MGGVKGLVGFVGMSVGGWLGWWLGMFEGIGTAVILSAIGSGFGLYYFRKLAEWYLE
jgi:hypothetical protein